MNEILVGMVFGVLLSFAVIFSSSSVAVVSGDKEQGLYTTHIKEVYRLVKPESAIAPQVYILPTKNCQDEEVLEDE